MNKGRAMRIALPHGLLITALAGLSVSLSGCVNLGGGNVPDRLIRFTPMVSLPAGSERSTRGVGGEAGTAILVAEPVTDRTLAVSRVAVQVDETRVAYLPDVAFVERPARLFRGLLAEALRVEEAGRMEEAGRVKSAENGAGNGGAMVLEDDQPAPIGSRRLSGRLLAMGYDARGHAVVVRFDALWQGADGVLASRRFEALEKPVSPSVSAVAPALNRVANDVAAQVAVWVGKQGAAR